MCKRNDSTWCGIEAVVASCNTLERSGALRARETACIGTPSSVRSKVHLVSPWPQLIQRVQQEKPDPGRCRGSSSIPWLLLQDSDQTRQACTRGEVRLHHQGASGGGLRFAGVSRAVASHRGE